MSNQTFKAWITKYALTSGIVEIDAHLSGISDSMICGPGTFDNYHGEGKDWHRSEACALVRDEEMRRAKVKSLEKQIEKLAKMKFL